MKYIRKIASLVIIFVLIASVAIGIGVVFAVKNVNVTLQSYAFAESSKEAEEEIAKYKKLILDEIRGTIIGFVSEEAVKEAIDDGNYNVVSMEKVYPCTLNVVLCERKEAYAVQKGAGFTVYDAYGEYLRTAVDEVDACNPIDGAPNVLIKGTDTQEQVRLVALLGNLFEKNFAPLRSTVESITLSIAQSQYAKSKVIYTLRCGLSVEIQDYDVLTEEKLKAAYREFVPLSGEEKLSGKIYCFGSGEGVDATYERVGLAG